MKTYLTSAITTLLLSSSAISQPLDTGRSRAGWYDLFPPYRSDHYPNYQNPIVGKKDGDNTTYSQTARFNLPFALDRAFRVTVARDPGFKKQYSRDAMKDAPVTAVKIGKRTAWVWNDKKKVVVPLSDDKAVLLEAIPPSIGTPFVDYAKSLDLDKIEKALAKPPRTDFTLTVETFAVFKKGDSLLKLQEWAGTAKSQEQIGKKEEDRIRWVYALKDGRNVLVTTVAGGIERISHEAEEGKVVELLK
jgi:hypothetical protein